MTIAIKVENVSKRYIIKHEQQSGHHRYETLGDTLVEGGKNIIHKIRHPFKSSESASNREEFWALKDINFEINQGDKVGIIGPNGAGKSTLLKILSRITEPTSGKIHINGRIASLLEVGTGFHPELTGRENIFLNGAILGMSRKEIKAKFDEIVAFAEVEKFLDTPVKRYSSGMYVRLAFSVAAHLEPEILVVDEVLAVGDAEFQKKCLGKMGEVSKQGRTVLFVSHNMSAIKSLCNRAILLDNGAIKIDANVEKSINAYLGDSQSSSFFEWTIENALGDDLVRIKKVAILDSEYNNKGIFCLDQDIFVRVSYWLLKDYDKLLNIQVRVFNNEQTLVFMSADTNDFLKTKSTFYSSTCKIPGDFMNNGSYNIDVYIATPQKKVHVYSEKAVSFDVSNTLNSERKNKTNYFGPVPGVVRPLLKWEHAVAENYE